MNVFLPYSDLKKSVSCLDPSRLGNQIYREAVILINGGWKNHPASKIWKGHEHRLAQYCLYGLAELESRGRYYPQWIDFFSQKYLDYPDTGLPEIVGYEPFHASHRSQLLRKDFLWYSKFGWTEAPGELEYVWKIP